MPLSNNAKTAITAALETLTNGQLIPNLPAGFNNNQLANLVVANANQLSWEEFQTLVRELDDNQTATRLRAVQSVVFPITIGNAGADAWKIINCIKRPQLTRDQRRLIRDAVVALNNADHAAKENELGTLLSTMQLARLNRLTKAEFEDILAVFNNEATGTRLQIKPDMPGTINLTDPATTAAVIISYIQPVHLTTDQRTCLKTVISNTVGGAIHPKQNERLDIALSTISALTTPNRLSHVELQILLDKCDWPGTKLQAYQFAAPLDLTAANLADFVTNAIVPTSLPLNERTKIRTAILGIHTLNAQPAQEAELDKVLTTMPPLAVANHLSKLEFNRILAALNTNGTCLQAVEPFDPIDLNAATSNSIRDKIVVPVLSSEQRLAIRNGISHFLADIPESATQEKLSALDVALSAKNDLDKANQLTWWELQSFLDKVKIEGNYLQAKKDPPLTLSSITAVAVQGAIVRPVFSYAKRIALRGAVLALANVPHPTQRQLDALDEKLTVFPAKTPNDNPTQEQMNDLSGAFGIGVEEIISVPRAWGWKCPFWGVERIPIDLQKPHTEIVQELSKAEGSLYTRVGRLNDGPYFASIIIGFIISVLGIVRKSESDNADLAEALDYAIIILPLILALIGTICRRLESTSKKYLTQVKLGLEKLNVKHGVELEMDDALDPAAPGAGAQP